jgi:hypothetical protein
LLRCGVSASRASYPKRRCQRSSPPDRRDAAIASVAAGFRDACIEHGMPVEAEDMAYYVKVVTAKVAEMTPRLVEIGLKAKK